jgi:undecaprenyl diphosphate synthase
MVIKEKSQGLLEAEALLQKISQGDMPRHIAIIMDGNGRWAKGKNLPRIQGHRAGVQTAKEIVKTCAQLKIEVLTLYAFSIENWKRPRSETNALMMLLEEFIQEQLQELIKNNIQFRPIGRLQGLPSSVQQKLQQAVEATKNNSGLVLALALNYGGRSEIVDAIKRLIKDVEVGLLKKEDVDEGFLSRYLYTGDLPDPDLLIRTSGEMRISNFLLWQLAYAELWVTPTLWPDFSRQDLYQAIYEYQQRERRFGRISEQCENDL